MKALRRSCDSLLAGAHASAVPDVLDDCLEMLYAKFWDQALLIQPSIWSTGTRGAGWQIEGRRFPLMLVIFHEVMAFQGSMMNLD